MEIIEVQVTIAARAVIEITESGCRVVSVAIDDSKIADAGLEGIALASRVTH